MSHDPLCPKTLHEYEHDDYTYYCDDRSKCETDYPCQCDLIATVRVDETARRGADPRLDGIARAIVDSEPFLWLMNGSNHPDAQADRLRPLWEAYRDAGGGWGKRRKDGEA